MRKLSQTEVEDRWGRMGELEKPIAKLTDQYSSYAQPDEHGDYPFSEEFFDQFSPLRKEQNTLSLSLMREVLRRNKGGKDYDCIYPAAGLDIDFPRRLGGEWTLEDMAYHYKRKWIRLERDGRVVYQMRIIRHDFTTESLPRGVRKGSMDVGLIRHPFGENSELGGESGNRLEKRTPKWGSVRWWNGLLINCVDPLVKGGILVSEDALEKMKHESDKIGAKRVIGRYQSQLGGMTGLLGLPTDCIPFVEYRERIGSFEPRKYDFHFYIKQV